MGWRIAAPGFLFSIIQWLANSRRCATITAAASCFMLLPSLAMSPRAPSTSAVSDGLRIRLLVANVHALNKSPDELLDTLLASDADVLVLTEPPPPIMQALRPNDRLAQQFPFVARSKPDRGTQSWLVVASRMPLTQASGASPGMNPVVVSASGRKIGLLATHMRSPRSLARYRQAREQVRKVTALANEFTSRNLPIILAGDLNAPPGSHLSRRLIRNTGTVRSKPRRFLTGSWPAQIPRWAALPIDGALVSPEITIDRWELVSLPGSDHRGLRIDLIIPKSDSDAQSHHSGSSLPDP